MHLTRDQLKTLTGYRQPARMCAWLKERRWVFEAPARRGDIPKVAVTYHDARMSGQSLQQPQARPAARFDWMSRHA